MHFEIVGLDCHVTVITTEYISRVHCIHMLHLFCNALVHVIYSVVSGQYSYTIFEHKVQYLNTKYNIWTHSTIFEHKVQYLNTKYNIWTQSERWEVIVPT